MDIRPIHTQKDYEMACERIEQIFHAEPGSKEDDELEILITLVDAYEERHFPIGAPLRSNGICENILVLRKRTPHCRQF